MFTAYTLEQIKWRLREHKVENNPSFCLFKNTVFAVRSRNDDISKGFVLRPYMLLLRENRK